jgi:hypothetical protein
VLFRISVDTFSRLTAETTGGPVGLSFDEFLLAGERGVLREAERLGNVSEACRRHGLPYGSTRFRSR